MPLLTYQCTRCGKAEERVVKHAERDAQRCTVEIKKRSFHLFGAPRSEPKTYPCNGTMTREEIELIADTPRVW